MQKYSSTVTDVNGNVVPTAQITVNTHGAGAATVYSDNVGTVRTQPFTPNSLGEFFFYAADGRYDVIATFGGQTYTDSDVLLFDPAASTGSAGVGYLPSGAGAVATTVLNKLRQVYIVPLDFGAVGDGTTNDGPALQLWANALSANANFRGELGPYCYLTNQTITVNPTTPNGNIPEIHGNGAQNSILRAGPSLGANPILKHQGQSPSRHVRWSGFSMEGTGAANGQWAIHHINTCFVNYDNITFEGFTYDVMFENTGGGFTEQNVLTNCWTQTSKYFIGFKRSATSTETSFRGTGFGANCHMVISTVANARAVHLRNDNAKSPYCYNMPLNISVWAGPGNYITQNDGIYGIDAFGDVTFETSASFAMGIGSGGATDYFVGSVTGMGGDLLRGSYVLDTIGRHTRTTFTPTLKGSTGDPSVVTYGSAGQQGWFTLSNNKIDFQIFLNISSYVGGTGDLIIGGLPFSCVTDFGGVCPYICNVELSGLTFSGYVTGRVLAGTTTLHLSNNTTGAASSALPLSALSPSNGGGIIISGSYIRG